MVTRRKTAWNKNQRREVWKTFGRFLSILAIVALGVGLFSGLKVTKNAMIDTADVYLSEYAMYDEKVLTTIGVSESEVASIAAMDGVLTMISNAATRPGLSMRGISSCEMTATRPTESCMRIWPWRCASNRAWRCVKIWGCW